MQPIEETGSASGWRNHLINTSDILDANIVNSSFLDSDFYESVVWRAFCFGLSKQGKAGRGAV